MDIALICECSDRYPTEINSWQFFDELKAFFEGQVEAEIFDDLPVKEAYYTWRSESQEVKWFADKWYKCRVCGCLWEFSYPDFPSVGWIRKFDDGVYHSET